MWYDSMTMDEKENSENVTKKLDEEDPKNEDNLKNEDEDFLLHELNWIELNLIAFYSFMCEIDSRRFFWKIDEQRLKNEQTSHQTLFQVYRVHGIQKNCLNLTINEFLTVWKTQ